MRLLPTKNLVPGGALGFPIRTQEGKILLSANATITEKYIERLLSFKINCVYVDDEEFKDVEICPAISDKTKSEALANVVEFHRGIPKKIIKDSLIRDSAKAICSDVISNIRSPLNLFNVYSIEDKRYLHLVNTAIVTAAISYYAEVSTSRIPDYVTAALLHDMALEDIDNAADTEHARSCYDFLKEARVFNNYICASVGMHHEHYDGSGSPKGFEGDKIFEGARILSVADQFDNLVYGIGCQQYPAHLAVEYLHTMSGKQLDPVLLTLFSKCIAIYPTGATVILNNGYRAIVIKQNEQIPTRPVVRLLMPQKENCVTINLIKNHTVFIESVEL